MTNDEFCEALKTAAEEVASEPDQMDKPWFAYNKTILLDAMTKHNILLHSVKESNLCPEELESTITELRNMQKYINVNDQIYVAKERWIRDLVSKVDQMNFNPADAWKAIDTIKLAMKSHHKKTTTFAFRKADGSLATTDKENISILETHFNKVFNNHKNVNFDVLNQLTQRPTLFEEDRPITYLEFDIALNNLANDKSPRENGVSPNLIKSLNERNRHTAYNFIVEFWEVRIIHKTGRDKTDTNNFRGINLMDVITKVLSIIINKRFFKILHTYGTKLQFGGTPGVGCREGIFTLKTLLHTR
jgi:hypothetical protein